MKSQHSPSPLLSISDATHILNIGRTNLYFLIKSGRIKALKIGRRTVISSLEIERFISQLDALEVR